MLLLFLVPAACAAIPYQQMSDARQAIDAAESVVGRDTGGQALLVDARSTLDRAEQQLRVGEYARARGLADDAKRLAINARHKAEQSTLDGATSDPAPE